MLHSLFNDSLYHSIMWHDSCIVYPLRYVSNVVILRRSTIKTPQKGIPKACDVLSLPHYYEQWPPKYSPQSASQEIAEEIHRRVRKNTTTNQFSLGTVYKKIRYAGVSRLVFSRNLVPMYDISLRLFVCLSHIRTFLSLCLNLAQSF